jgi:SAM-dependent methyltransferase
MWNRRAAAWVEWARDPELDDDFWSFHLEAFLSLVPEPGRLTLDLAAGEGRVTRELQRRGHTVIGVDSSPAVRFLLEALTPGGATAIPSPRLLRSCRAPRRRQFRLVRQLPSAIAPLCGP